MLNIIFYRENYLRAHFGNYGHVFHTRLNWSDDFYKRALDTICVQQSPESKVQYKKADLRLEKFTGSFGQISLNAREVCRMLTDLYLNDSSQLVNWEVSIRETIELNLKMWILEPKKFSLYPKIQR